MHVVQYMPGYISEIAVGTGINFETIMQHADTIIIISLISNSVEIAMNSLSTCLLKILDSVLDSVLKQQRAAVK